MLGSLLIACKARRAPHGATAPEAAPASPAEAAVWPELRGMPLAEPVRVIALPARPDVPRFATAGPVIAGDIAVLASSQLGFAGVDFRRGRVAWTKPAGLDVAPPVFADGDVHLVGDCANPPDVPPADLLLGCLRVVTPSGADRAYLAIRGTAARVEAFAGSPGEQRLWIDRAEAGQPLIWRRGDEAVRVDRVTGIAAPTEARDPPLVIRHKDRAWEITRTEDGIIEARGKPAWRTQQSYTALIGGVYLPEQSPMARVVGARRFRDDPELLVFDIDATGSLHGQVSMSPAPGIGLLGHATSSVGDAALAIRLDSSLERDYIAGYAANALLVWVYPLPRVPRPDPVGVAMTSDAVLVFHDGDTLAVLPEVSAPPTAPGAVRAPPENATP